MSGSLNLIWRPYWPRRRNPGSETEDWGVWPLVFWIRSQPLEIPAIGYGIRYEFGIFDQVIRDGYQVEVTDKWLKNGNPWEIPQPGFCYQVGFGGRTESGIDETGRFRVRWIPERVIRGVAYDTPVPGYKANTVNLLRLWKAEACESFDFSDF